MGNVKLRVLIDTDEKKDVFRDILIGSQQSLDDLHKAIYSAFEFSGQEMASFYTVNEEWDRLKEYPQEMLAEKGQANLSNTKVEDLLKAKEDRLLYVYDFFRMWCFFVEVIEVGTEKINKAEVLLSSGNPPAEDSKDPDFTMEGMGGNDDDDPYGLNDDPYATDDDFPHESLDDLGDEYY